MSAVYKFAAELRLFFVVALALLLAPWAAIAEQPKFYDPAGLPPFARPGKVLRAEAMDGAPAGASAYRVVYQSTGLDGRPVPVSGVVIAPAGPAHAGGRPVVAWAHPTTGVEDQCAPSRACVFFSMVQGLSAMLDRGYAVAATDYEGLGMPGPHPYLVGTSEGRSVLDSVRAARAIPEIGAGGRFAVWGHSQGGQAALFTGILAQDYAPELDLVGVAAAAPATELATLLSDDIDTSGGRNLTAMTLWSWSRVYKAPIDAVVTPEAIPVVDRLTADCIERIFDVLKRLGPTRALDRSFLRTDRFDETEPWRSLLARNTPGVLPRGVPLFLAQGTEDDLVRPAVTKDYADRNCRAGRSVKFDWLPKVGHLFAARDSAAAAVAWMEGRFSGEPAPSDCEPAPAR